MDSRLDMSQQCDQVAKKAKGSRAEQEWCGQPEQGSDFFPCTQNWLGSTSSAVFSSGPPI